MVKWQTAVLVRVTCPQETNQTYHSLREQAGKPSNQEEPITY